MNAYRNQVIKGQMHVWLQDCGWCPAKLGSELKAGDKLACNFGYIDEIVSIDKETAKTITVTVRGYTGSLYSGVRIGKDTYKAIAK